MSDLSRLIERLGLTDDEALEVFGLAPLDAIGGEVGHRPELGILGTLTEEAAEQVGEAALRSWVRMPGQDGVAPVELLAQQRFAAFEDALQELIRRGFVVRGGGNA